MTRPSHPFRIVGLLLGLGLLANGGAHAADARRPKKLIATGWDEADTRRLLQNLAAMEQQPFDGVVLRVFGRISDTQSCNLRTAFRNEPWQREWFEPPIRDLKACQFKRFTDNFIALGANPGDVDWFDDAGWRAIVDHWRLAAWVAKQSGVKGILFDPEPYSQPHLQFGYSAQPQREKHPFDAYAAKAREREHEVMEAVAAEFPAITLYSYFMNSVNGHATGHADPRRVLAASGYGLFPAFIDGWLDAAPPTVTLVDGCESAYRYNSVLDYLEAGTLMKGACQELVSPENRAKYRAQVQVSFGVYLDAYWNPKDSPWHIDGLGGSRVDRLRANVQTALRVADKYVWVYGEKFRWWPTPNTGVKPQSWPEALPGCDRALGLARDPLAYARARIADLTQAGTLASLARNGDFGSDKARSLEGTEVAWKEGTPPAGWGTWQVDAPRGTLAWDREAGVIAKGSARATGVANGCFIQAYPAKPGEMYAIRAARRLHGRGEAHLRVRWQTPDGKWTAEDRDVLLYADGPADAWGELFGVAEVPEGVGRILILLGISGQSSPQDAAWFDDVELWKIE